MWAALFAGAIALILAWIEPLLIKLILQADLWVRSVILFLVVALLALPLGVPFSSGLRMLNSATPGKTSLLWGWNASAAVLGSALAVSLAMLVGFSWSLSSSAVCYLALALLVMWMNRRHLVW
jgi:biotin transporter BioY